MDTRGEGGGVLGPQPTRPLGCDRPRAGDRPTATDHAGEESLPALGCLVREDDGADAILAKHPSTLGEGSRHRLFKPRAVLWTVIIILGLVLHGLASFLAQWILGIERIAQ